MSDVSALTQYFRELGQVDKLDNIIKKIGEDGSCWLNSNINKSTNLSAKLDTAQKMINLLLDDRQTVANGWKPEPFKPIGLVRSTGKFEPVIYVNDDFHNVTFKTIKEYRDYQKNPTTSRNMPWVKAKFFFFQLHDNEIPNDMVNLSDESQDDSQGD